MPDRAVAIANEFLRPSRGLGQLTQMQLQKLTYIANGWNLAINDAPLVSDAAEAWDYGPVYRDLYDHTKYFGNRKIERPITPEDDLVAYCSVVAAFLALAGWGSRTGFVLSDTILAIIAGSTAVSVIGLMGMVVTGIFGRARPAKSAAKRIAKSARLDRSENLTR